MSIYYTGKNGVYNYGGKDYKFGDELPADIPAETVEAFMAKGKMSTTRPTADAPPAPSSEVELLKGRIATLDQQLTAAVDEGVKLSADLQTAQQTITELTNQLTASPAPAPPAPPAKRRAP